MKHVGLQLSLVAILLAAVAVPAVGNGAKVGDARKAGIVAVEPEKLANAGPVPWCKDKKCAATAPLVKLANAGPVPWCPGKKCSAQG